MSILVMLLSFSLSLSLKIVVSIRPLELMVKEIVGGTCEVNVMVPEGSNPHTYSLTLKDRKTIEEADVVFILGEGFDGWLRSTAPDKVHVLSKDFKREFSENVHIWLDPVAVLWMALEIRDIVAKLDPANAEAYHENFCRFACTLYEKWESVSWKPDKPVLEFHPALYHLIRRLGGKLLWITSGHGESLSLGRLRKLIAECKKSGVNTLVVEKDVNYGIAAPFIEALNPRIVEVDVLGWNVESYTDLLMSIVHALETLK